MSTQLLSHDDCECCSGITRRTFLKATVVGAAAVAASPLPSLAVSQAEKAATKKATSETLVTTLFKSLNEEQQKSVCFPFDHPLRSKVDNNWMITDKKISEFYTKDQQAMIREIFTGLHSPEYAGKVAQQVEHDGGKEGFGGCSIALFGQPGTGKFEFVLAGRHVTRRCDGDYSTSRAKKRAPTPSGLPAKPSCPEFRSPHSRATRSISCAKSWQTCSPRSARPTPTKR